MLRDIVLQRDGRDVECAIACTPAEAVLWIEEKKHEWSTHTPKAHIIVIEMDHSEEEEEEDDMEMARRLR